MKRCAIESILRFLSVPFLVALPMWGLIENYSCHLYETSCKLYEYKKRVLKERPFNSIVVGGSNVVNGFDSAELSIGDIIFFNAGLNYEGGNFNNYLEFLGDIFRKDEVKFVVYSSFDFLKRDIEIDSTVNILGRKNLVLPNVSIRKYLSYQKQDFLFDKLGNVSKDFYSACGKVSYRKVDDLDLFLWEIKEGQNKWLILRQRMLKIREMFPKAKIVLAVPPVFIRKDDSDILYVRIEKQLKNEFTDAIVVVPSNSIRNSFSYFCDESHLNLQGRIKNTLEIKRALFGEL